MIGRSARIAIVGGGLAGLAAARLLQQQGVQDVVLFEAREAPGGRIQSIGTDGQAVRAATPPGSRFDVGPTWFWPELQPQLGQWIDALGLQHFEQHDEGDMLLERSASEPAMRLPGFASEPRAMRLLGGTGALIDALQARIDTGCVRLGETVLRLSRQDGHVLAQVASASGEAAVWRVEQVLLALPPRLAERRIVFDPPLPHELAGRWRDTPTWMAPHAKYLAIYETPFWRTQGLSGAARSGHGPMGEVHDHTVPGGPAALFGFLAVPAGVRRSLPEPVLRAHCRAQLVRLFGACAAAPMADALKDWASDPLTATDDDHQAAGHHAEAPPPAADAGPWRGCLTGIGSEWSPQFPGYLAGAVDAASRGVQRCLAAVAARRQTPGQ